MTPSAVLIRIANFGAVLSLAGGVALTESATSLPRSQRQWAIYPRAEDVHITAADGAIMRGACFLPRGTPKGAVIILHGVGDQSYSMAGLAMLMTQHGYAALTPDSRAHGGSGGARITYGILERDDVHRWVDWMTARFHTDAIYGYGASLGGGILIQSLAVEPRFKAIIAECPFYDFHSVAYDRAHGLLPIPKALFAPMIEPAFLYARIRLGLDLHDASPARVLQNAQTPLLLIHGTADSHIPVEHSRRLHAISPATTELWEVPGAEHVDSWATAGKEFERRVVDWFATH